MMAALLVLSGCASDKLALAPPRGVDFSGKWQLNEADSDDPQRLAQSQSADPSKVGRPGGQGGGQGGGGRGGRGRGGGGYGGPTGPTGPATPAMGALGAGLRWPGKSLEVKQTGGTVAMSSGGAERVYAPSAASSKARERPKPVDDVHRPEDQDTPAHGRGGGAPAVCGWEEKTLVVQSVDRDEDHPPFEQRYSLSDDGQRLIEVVGFKSGRSAGFTMSRVWDRVVPGAAPPGGGATAPAPAAPAGGITAPATTLPTGRTTVPAASAPAGP